MFVSDIKCSPTPNTPDRTRVSAQVRYDDHPGQSEALWFDLPSDLIDGQTPDGDAWLAALLPLACKLGEDLRIDAPLDSVLLEGATELMEWWRYWFPTMRLVRIFGTGPAQRYANNAARTAQFFSGGVDSFFTLLRHAPADDPIQVDDLLVGWGFDIPLRDAAAFERVTESMAKIAAQTGKRLIPFATNIRETRSGSNLHWGTIGHGSAMAAIALLLKHSYQRVLIPSTDGYRETGPWGSHATTDHYYSTASMRVIHDGAAYSRLQKVELIAQSPVPLGALRVCWRSQGDSNCGRCEKCLRTMVSLELCGVLGKATTFPQTTLDLKKIAQIYCPWKQEGSLQLYYTELRDAAAARGRSDIARAVTRAMRSSSWKEVPLYVTQRLSHLPLFGAAFRYANSVIQRSMIV